MNVGNEMGALELMLGWVCLMPVVVPLVALIGGAVLIGVRQMVRAWYVQRALQQGATCTYDGGIIKIRHTK